MGETVEVKASPRDQLARRRAAKLAAQRDGTTVEIPYLGEILIVKFARMGSTNHAHKKAMEAFRAQFRNAATGEVDESLIPVGAKDEAIKLSLASNVVLDLQVKGAPEEPYTTEIGTDYLKDDDLYIEFITRATSRETFEASALKADAGN